MKETLSGRDCGIDVDRHVLKVAVEVNMHFELCLRNCVVLTVKRNEIRMR